MKNTKIKNVEILIAVSAIVALVLSIISNFYSREAILISRHSNEISKLSNNIAEQARKDVRAIEKLDLEPYITASLDFYKNNYHFDLINTGLIDAIQLQIQFNTLRYDSLRDMIRIYIAGSDQTIYIDKLSAHEQKSLVVPEPFFKNTILADPLNSVIEVCILFRKDPDRKQYGFRMFYFPSSEGKWVSENNSALDTLIFNKRILAARNSRPCNGVSLTQQTSPIYKLNQKTLDSLLKISYNRN